MDFPQTEYEKKRKFSPNILPSSAPPVARLQQKVARLEIALRDKESENGKLCSSTKVNLVNELKIQTEMYYQEVLRLRGQLQLLQESHYTLATSRSHESTDEKISSERLKGNSNNINEKLMESIDNLKRENRALSDRLSSVMSEKERCTMNRTQVNQGDSLSQKANDAAIQTTPQPESLSVSPLSQIFGSSEETLVNILKSQIEELRAREKVWEDERVGLKELVEALKEDRIFYKEASKKKDEESTALRKEMIKLHKEIIVLQNDMGLLHLNGRSLCGHCAKTNFHNLKSTRKTQNGSGTYIIKDEASHTFRPPSAGRTKNKLKSPSKSSKSLPLSLKSPRMDGRRSRSKSPMLSSGKCGKSSTLSTSRSSSASSTHCSPSHLENANIKSSKGSPSPRRSFGENLEIVDSGSKAKEPMSENVYKSLSKVSPRNHSPSSKSSHSLIKLTVSPKLTTPSPKIVSTHPNDGRGFPKAPHSIKLHSHPSKSPSKSIKNRKLPTSSHKPNKVVICNKCHAQRKSVPPVTPSVPHVILSVPHDTPSHSITETPNLPLLKSTLIDRQANQCVYSSKCSTEEDSEVANEILKNLDKSGLEEYVNKKYIEALNEVGDESNNVVTDEIGDELFMALFDSHIVRRQKLHRLMNHSSAEEIKIEGDTPNGIKNLSEKMVALLEAHIARKKFLVRVQ